jgi:hypothetical protein
LKSPIRLVTVRAWVSGSMTMNRSFLGAPARSSRAPAASHVPAVGLIIAPPVSVLSTRFDACSIFAMTATATPPASVLTAGARIRVL